MAFWDKKPKEGETEEQRKQREAAEEQAFIDRIGLSVEQKIEAKLKPVSEAVTTLQADWQKLRAAADESANEDANANLTDEQKRARDSDAQNRLTLGLAIATNARITENEVLASIRTKFPQFEQKVTEVFANTPLERKGKTDYQAYCQNVVRMVIGGAALDGGLRYDQTAKRFFLEDNSSSNNDGTNYDFLGSDNTWQDPKSGKIMTAAEQLAKLGIKPEEFAKSIEKGIV